jgi:single-strand DNA-binding protein
MAATNICRVVLTGNLTKPPKLVELPSGAKVCEMRVACNTRHKDPESGEWGDKGNFYNVKVWGAQGANCERYLDKGSAVAIDGRLDWREWPSKDGSGKREAVDIVADTVQFTGSPNGSGTPPGAVESGLPPL